ncbi:histidinol-phosphate transaminase [Rariglobus hedericola]|uniref:Histidinol-phosphate aminotransferase n=1 Tax=Rariglobus hedericola TaxID=2597822 RepID=A0A556QKY3_9BACT|nr:histidinol-phosphate transaminase [Rariglobus hedericola]TSJ77271.1 histidinol-phosphate transaminase [Rariglobus hedericola]
MSSSFSVPALPHIQKLHAYTPGLQPTGPGWVKLNTNECPYSPSPRAAEAIKHELADEGDLLRLYPNPKSTPLRQFVAKLHGLREENVLIGNGSDDVLNLLVRVFGGPSAATGFTLPSYSLYPVLVAINDGTTTIIEFDRSMKLPVEKIVSSGARAFFLTSPNAPTGVAFTNAELSAVLDKFPGVLVVDEAYAPFAKENAVSLLARYPNLVITRTLSKAHALAGLRVGYALASAEIIELLDRVRDSYNVNRLSQAAALAALSDTGYYDAIIGKIIYTRDYWVSDWSDRLGWFIYPTQTNFIFAEPKNSKGETGPAVAKSLYDFFLAQKILVRAFPSHALTAPFLRISVGSDDEMFSVNKAIEAWLAT